MPLMITDPTMRIPPATTHSPKDFCGNYIAFPVRYSFYTLHGWLIQSVRHCIVFGTVEELLKLTTFRSYSIHVKDIADAIANGNSSKLIAPLVDKAPAAKPYIASVLDEYEKTFARLDLEIRQIFEPWLDEVEPLSELDKVAVFEDFFELNWPNENSFDLYHACYHYCFSTHLSYLASLWRMLEPQELKLVYSLSDYFDDYDDDYDERLWDPAFARCSHVFVYLDTGKQACAKCGEVAPAGATFWYDDYAD